MPGITSSNYVNYGTTEQKAWTETEGKAEVPRQDGGTSETLWGEDPPAGFLTSVQTYIFHRPLTT
jgi:hypothetical protein